MLCRMMFVSLVILGGRSAQYRPHPAPAPAPGQDKEGKLLSSN